VRETIRRMRVCARVCPSARPSGSIAAYYIKRPADCDNIVTRSQPSRDRC